MNRMINRDLSRNPPSIYNIHDRVLLKYKDSHHKVPKKYHVLKGKVVKRNLRLSRYKLLFTPPHSHVAVAKWFSMNDITSVTQDIERRRTKKYTVQYNTQTKNKYYIRYTREDRLASFQSAGFAVRLDPTPNGNCQFAAIADQLKGVGILRSAQTSRQEITHDLRAHPFASDGTPLQNFVDNNNLDNYLTNMEHYGTFGDHITLQRASELCNVQFVVLSTLGRCATRIISPTGHFADGLPTLVLGHIAEEQGEHYVSLQGNVGNYIHVLQQDAADDCRSDSYFHEQLPVPEHEHDAAYDIHSDSCFHENFQTSVLPNEIIEEIIKQTLVVDMSMQGTFNRVSKLVRDLTSKFYPHIHMPQSLSEVCKLSETGESHISVRRLVRNAGRGSGVAMRIREMFAKKTGWFNSWLVLSKLPYGRHAVTDIYWK